MQMALKFKEIYWNKDQSTKVQFELLSQLPDISLVTSCFVFAQNPEKKIAMVRAQRGWGLPGGHRKANESPEECVIREVNEEAYIKISNLSLIGGWKATKVFNTKRNAVYPKIGYQLLFLSDIEKILEFKGEFETFERKFVSFEQLSMLHNCYDIYGDVFQYLSTLCEQ